MLDLPFVGRCFSQDEAVQNAWKADMELINSLLKALEAGKNEKDGKGLDFIKVLAALGLTPPADGNQATAAAQFLTAAKPAMELLAKLQADAAVAWDWSTLPCWKEEPAGNSTQTQLLPKLVLAAKLEGQLARAKALCKDSAGAEAGLRALRLLATRAGEAPSLLGTLVKQATLNLCATYSSRIMEQGGWTEAQLASLLSPNPGPNPLLVIKHGLEVEADNMEARAADVAAHRKKTAEFKALVNQQADKSQGWSDLFTTLQGFLTPDSLIENQLGFNASVVRHVADQVAADGAFTAYPEGWDTPLSNSNPENTTLMDRIFNLGLGEFDVMDTGVYARILLNAVKNQSREDLLRIQAGMELYHRQHGGYPDNLTALQPWFPNGVPNDPITQAPYHFTKDADSLKVWAEGPMNRNKDGALKDELTTILPVRK